MWRSQKVYVLCLFFLLLKVPAGKPGLVGGEKWERA